MDSRAEQAGGTTDEKRDKGSAVKHIYAPLSDRSLQLLLPPPVRMVLPFLPLAVCLWPPLALGRCCCVCVCLTGLCESEHRHTSSDESTDSCYFPEVLREESEILVKQTAVESLGAGSRVDVVVARRTAEGRQITRRGGQKEASGVHGEGEERGGRGGVEGCECERRSRGEVRVGVGQNGRERERERGRDAFFSDTRAPPPAHNNTAQRQINKTVDIIKFLSCCLEPLCVSHVHGPVDRQPPPHSARQDTPRSVMEGGK